VIIDQVQRLFAGPALGAEPIVQSYGAHPITRGFGTENVSIYTLASSVRQGGTKQEGATYTELLKTSPTSWAESNVAGVFDPEEPTAAKEEGDLVGPVSIAMAYEKPLKKGDDTKTTTEESVKKQSRLLVFGDADFLQNGKFGNYSNRDVAVNAVNWSAGEEGAITIRPRSMKSSMAPISQDTYLFLLVSSFVLPELILIVGLFIWWSRRQVSFA
jgi:ABC-type uncharacterized transport system involved in gliding motility auxiliary subunit